VISKILLNNTALQIVLLTDNDSLRSLRCHSEYSQQSTETAVF